MYTAVQLRPICMHAGRSQISFQRKFQNDHSHTYDQSSQQTVVPTHGHGHGHGCFRVVIVEQYRDDHDLHATNPSALHAVSSHDPSLSRLAIAASSRCKSRDCAQAYLATPQLRCSQLTCKHTLLDPALEQTSDRGATFHRSEVFEVLARS